MKETELLLTSFAEKHLDTLSKQELLEFEQLLDCPDADILSWVLGNAPCEITLVSKIRRVMS